MCRSGRYTFLDYIHPPTYQPTCVFTHNESDGTNVFSQMTGNVAASVYIQMGAVDATVADAHVLNHSAFVLYLRVLYASLSF